MSQELEAINALQVVVAETSGTALTISPKEDKWSGYLLQQKLHFEEKTLPELATTIAKHICEKRVQNEVESKGKRKVKPYKYTA